MSRVRGRDTHPEMRLRRALWAAGIRGWRVHSARYPGKPDVAFVGRKVAVFVDGAFWHGHPDYYRGQSGPFWDVKIAQNRERDRRVNVELARLGWRTLRFWDFEVEKDLRRCVQCIADALEQAQSP